MQNRCCSGATGKLPGTSRGCQRINVELSQATQQEQARSENPTVSGVQAPDLSASPRIYARSVKIARHSRFLILVLEEYPDRDEPYDLK
jgi:hypothetical protein